MSGVSSTAVLRLRKDAVRLAKDPIPFVSAVPLSSNILEWHYVVQGPPDSVYAGGIYHGKLVFPREYPFKPPSIYMLTPNGRFQINSRLCLSISDFHPDTWNPAWSVGTILTGLLSFMLETTSTLGSIETSNYEKRQLAFASGPYNIKNKTFRDLFPELCKEIQQGIDERDRRNKEMVSAKLKSETAKSDGAGPTADGCQNNGSSKENAANAKKRAAFLGSPAASNILVFAGMVAFVFFAKYLLQSTE